MSEISQGWEELLKVTAPPSGIAPTPAIVTEEGAMLASSVVPPLIEGRSLARPIVPPDPDAQDTVLAPPAVFESVIACRSEPAPASELFETLKIAWAFDVSAKKAARTK